MKSAEKVFNCFICGGDSLQPVITLGDQPMSGIFPLPDESDPASAPLIVERCSSEVGGEECGHLQLSHIANFDNMYGQNYGYHSSLSFQMVEHLKEISRKIKQLTEISTNDWILDIGCNDGTLLANFLDVTKNMVGVDPSAAKFSNLLPKNVELFVDYFPSQECFDFMGERKFKSITSIAMFYDLPRPHEFAKAVFEALDEDGIWTVELAEMNEFLKNLSYDQICHEHLLYLDNYQMVKLARNAGFELIELTYSEINGGSACYYFRKRKPKSKQNLELLSKVSKRQIEQLARRIYSNKKQVMDYLELLVASGKIIYGYGASTKGNVLMNYYGITSNVVSAISDINSFKHGRVTPGNRISIISHEEMRGKNPDYLIVFIWHLRKEVLISEKEFVMSGGRIIFPLPRLLVVDSENYFQVLENNINDDAFDISNIHLTK